MLYEVITDCFVSPCTGPTGEIVPTGGAEHLDLARESLRELIDDPRLPGGIRESLAHDYEQVQAMLDKLQHGHLHIAAFGRVSTGKSSLLSRDASSASSSTWGRSFHRTRNSRKSSYNFV